MIQQIPRAQCTPDESPVTATVAGAEAGGGEVEAHSGARLILKWTGRKKFLNAKPFWQGAPEEPHGILEAVEETESDHGYHCLYAVSNRYILFSLKPFFIRIIDWSGMFSRTD